MATAVARTSVCDTFKLKQKTVAAQEAIADSRRWGTKMVDVLRSSAWELELKGQATRRMAENNIKLSVVQRELNPLKRLSC